VEVGVCVDSDTASEDFLGKFFLECFSDEVSLTWGKVLLDLWKLDEMETVLDQL
jgi:hypothetical protein